MTIVIISCFPTIYKTKKLFYSENLYVGSKHYIFINQTFIKTV